MPSFQGKIVKGDETLADGVDIWIDITQGPRLRSWSGSFDLPDDHSFSFVEHSQCEVVLADGRKGSIIPTRCDGITVEFQGSGPLQ
jgi:hypothetical protein